MSFDTPNTPRPVARPRTKRLPDMDRKLTNKELRERALMELVRKFRPLQSKAILETVRIMNNAAASDSNKLKAAAFLVSTYKQLIAEVYDYRYDTDEGEEINKSSDTSPVFSLKVVNGSDESKSVE